MSRFIDMHTHQTHTEAGVVAVRSLWKDWDTLKEDQFYTIGIHPWHFGNTEKQLAELRDHSTRKNVIAIGECGLDRVCDTDYAVQLPAFEAQIALAEERKKPLIIHCVRAWDDVFRMLRGVSVPVLFHGFNKGPAVLEQICAAGYYASFGPALLRNDSNAAEHLPFVPATRFFLESDDTATPVSAIYEAAARLRKCTMDDLILQMETNFYSVFGL